MTGIWGACADVEEFMDAAGQTSPGKPSTPPPEILKLRRKLMSEEFGEMMRELHKTDPDPVKLGKEISDLIVVAIGTARAFGLPLETMWEAVHISNMSKIDRSTGKPYEMDDGGKVLKGPNFIPAEQLLVDVVELARTHDGE